MKKSVLFLLFIVFVIGVFVLYKWATFPNPDFFKMDCKSMEITYWVKIRENEKLALRRFEITDKATIDSLKQCFIIEKVEGVAVPTTCESKIILANGKRWEWKAIFKERFIFAANGDPYLEFRVILYDYTFHNKLLELCLNNERKTNPNATLRNITVTKGYLDDLLRPLFPSSNAGNQGF